MPPQIKNNKKISDKSNIDEQKPEEELKKLFEFDYDKLTSKIAESAEIPTEYKKGFIDYARKNPKSIIKWLSVITPMLIEDIDFEKTQDQSTVIFNFNTNIFNIIKSQATVSTGEKSVGTLLSEKINTQTNVEDSIIGQLRIISDRNPEFSNEINQFEKELKQAKTKKEKTSILTRIGKWYDIHKDEIKCAEQLMTSVLNGIYNLIPK